MGIFGELCGVVHSKASPATSKVSKNLADRAMSNPTVAQIGLMRRAFV